MSHKTNLSAAELARRIEQHLPVFVRPVVDDLIAAVRRETKLQEAAAVRDEYPPARTFVAPPNAHGSTASPRRHEAETPD